ncbi:MAG: signal peptidase I [Phocaeicola sp.]|uniref:signal peptidase I n=1 Tax=Phocaeicola sp. TaxID=2773926 RepID=UPI003F9F401B
MKRHPVVIVLRTFVLVVFVVLLCKTFVVTSCTIPSTGMENGLYKGERVLVNKWSYGLRLPFSTKRWCAREAKSGDVIVFNNPNPRDNTISIYNRDVFVSRCKGAPGDTLMLNDGLTITNDEVFSPDIKSFYLYPLEEEKELLPVLNKLGINEQTLVGYQDGNYIRNLSHYECYLIRQELKGKINLTPLYKEDTLESHPFVIPKKGFTVKVYPWNVKLLCNTISRHEGKRASVRNDMLYVDGYPVLFYTFTKDYYWMTSDNPVNISDSRLFGLVPDTHLIGKVGRVWFSTRGGRLFKSVR